MRAFESSSSQWSRFHFRCSCCRHCSAVFHPRVEKSPCLSFRLCPPSISGPSYVNRLPLTRSLPSLSSSVPPLFSSAHSRFPLPVCSLPIFFCIRKLETWFNDRLKVVGSSSQEIVFQRSSLKCVVYEREPFTEISDHGLNIGLTAPCQTHLRFIFLYRAFIFWGKIQM